MWSRGHRRRVDVGRLAVQAGVGGCSGERVVAAVARVAAAGLAWVLHGAMSVVLGNAGRQHLAHPRTTGTPFVSLWCPKRRAVESGPRHGTKAKASWSKENPQLAAKLYREYDPHPRIPRVFVLLVLLGTTRVLDMSPLRARGIHPALAGAISCRGKCGT
jgi:hypothetical protein